MPGLLDFFTGGGDPAQQQGLLAAASALLQAGGPSRMPISTGQGIGAALGAYQQGFHGAQDRQQQKELYDIKLKDMQSDLANQEMLRARAKRIAERLAAGQQLPGAATDAQQAPMASAMPGGEMSPRVGGPDWMQAYQQQADGQMPAAQAPATASAAPRVNQTDAYVQRLLTTADAYAAEGDIDGANKLYEQAAKLRPKYSTEFRQAQDANGKLRNYVLADDGTFQDTGLGVAPNLTEVDLGGSKQFVDKNGIAPGTSFNKTMTFADRQAAARLAFDKSQASGGDDAASFTQAAIDNAAARYNFDGTLPPMGMGKAAAAGRTKILNRAGELKAGVDPTQQREDQWSNKGDVAARNAAVRSFGVGKDGQAVQSANTALNHLDTIRQLAEAQKSGDVRAFNQAARALGAQFGQTAPTNLSAALIMVAPEVSKAVIGAGGTGHERDEAIKALNPNGSPDQIIGATQTMQELFGGRLTEAKRTYERTTKQKDFDDAYLSPAARQVLSRAEAHGAPAPAGQFSVQAPNGKTYTFKTARDMANFKLSAGIR